MLDKSPDSWHDLFTGRGHRPATKTGDQTMYTDFHTAKAASDKATDAWQGANRWDGDDPGDHVCVVIVVAGGYEVTTRNEARGHQVRNF